MGTNQTGIIRAGLATAILCGVLAFSRSVPAQDNDLPAPPVTGLMLDHVTLSVASLTTEAEWYERVLGFKVFSKNQSDPGFLNWHLVIPGFRIDLIQYKGSKRPAATDPNYLQQGWIHVAFHVKDVAAAWKTLQALHVDVKVNKDDKDVPVRLLIKDPEGNEIEIRRDLAV